MSSIRFFVIVSVMLIISNKLNKAGGAGDGENINALGSHNTKATDKGITLGSQDTNMTDEDYDGKPELDESDWDSDSETEIGSEEFMNLPYVADATPDFTCMGIITNFGFVGISGVDCLIIHDVVKYAEILAFIHKKFEEHIVKLAEERDRLAHERDRETDETKKTALQRQLVEAEETLRKAEVQRGDLQKHMEYIQNEDQAHIAQLEALKQRLQYINESLKDFMDNILNIGIADTDNLEVIQAYQAKLEGKRQKLEFLKGYMDHVNMNTDSCKIPEMPEEIARVRTVPIEELPPTDSTNRMTSTPPETTMQGVEGNMYYQPVQSSYGVIRKPTEEPRKDMRQEYCTTKKPT